MKRLIKNPHLNDIEEFIKQNSIYFEPLEPGGEAYTYLFQTDKTLILNANLLYPNVYVLKVYHFDYQKRMYGENFSGLSLKKINKFLELSNYGLIPKIYTITKKYIIMDYVEGKTLRQIKKEYGPGSAIVRKITDRISKLEDIWRGKLKLERVVPDRGNDGNFIVANGFETAKQPKVYIIDPRIYL